MATVPPGPSSVSPVEISPSPRAGGREAAGGHGAPACHGEDYAPAATGKKLLRATEVKRSVKKKQKNMLARASPAALHLKIQAREQQQLNGLASPSGDGDSHQHPRNRPDNPRPSVDNCDSGSEEAPVVRNNSEHYQHEGPFSKNGTHSPLINNSVNGLLDFTRTEVSESQHGDEGKEDFDHAEAPRSPCDELPDAAVPGGDENTAVPPERQPPAAELARLNLSGGAAEESHGIRYVRYESELQMPWIMRLITKDLSEPYSIYTYRYFIHNWPQLCFLAMVEQECVGAIVCKLDMHKKMFRRGYIAMLAVDSKHRRKSIGTNLVKKAIYAMVDGDCDEVVLETEITNKSALKLYENLGFVRDKRLFRYYLNGVDALRLKLWLR
ncbi:N-alpha-acetyltransferase 30 [Thalassophryne amazonica]|uniref:N-alpha-acetyltransferase 30 n=1 Tax=Thalassophryne amazonica TaxID=390379 RepID=UPI00147256FA|nr:N-alpha-acetyltransferase 30 [Thalassophryne amazonica]